MGNTCSSVHIALSGTTTDALKGIVRAYITLGFERAKTAPLNEGRGLDDLELALLPVLPVESVRVRR